MFSSIAARCSETFQLEDVIVEMTMPKQVQNCMLISSAGKCSFDPTTKLLHWNIGKIELGKPPTLKGSVCCSFSAFPSPFLQLFFLRPFQLKCKFIFLPDDHFWPRSS